MVFEQNLNETSADHSMPKSLKWCIVDSIWYMRLRILFTSDRLKTLPRAVLKLFRDRCLSVRVVFQSPSFVVVKCLALNVHFKISRWKRDQGLRQEVKVGTACDHLLSVATVSKWRKSHESSSQYALFQTFFDALKQTDFYINAVELQDILDIDTSQTGPVRSADVHKQPLEHMPCGDSHSSLNIISLLGSSASSVSSHCVIQQKGTTGKRKRVHFASKNEYKGDDDNSDKYWYDDDDDENDDKTTTESTSSGSTTGSGSKRYSTNIGKGVVLTLKSALKPQMSPPPANYSAINVSALLPTTTLTTTTDKSGTSSSTSMSCGRSARGQAQKAKSALPRTEYPYWPYDFDNKIMACKEWRLLLD